MSEEMLRDFFNDCRTILHINLGQFCDRNMIYRSDFTNFMKGKRFFTHLSDLIQMRNDVLDHINRFKQIY